MMKTILKVKFTLIFSIFFLFIAFVNVNAQDTGPWEFLNEGIDGTLNTIDFVNGSIGWITGHGALLKTEDGGETWLSLPIEENYIFEMIDFISESVGWAVGNDTSDTDYRPPGRGVILKTSDGGENRNVQVDDLIGPLNTLHFKDGFGWAVGRNGLVLRTKDGSTWIDENNVKIYPNKFSLSQNYPNPFNPSTTLSWQLVVDSEVDLSIYNILGEKVTNLVAEKQKAGYHRVEWDASGFASGVYLYRLSAKGKSHSFVNTRKLVLLK